MTGQDDAAKAPEAGIYVGDSANANATVWKNVSYGNMFGVFIRDAAHGKVLKNKTFSNCVGIVFLNTDEADVPPGQTPGPSVDVKDWLAQGNNVDRQQQGVCGWRRGAAVLGNRDRRGVGDRRAPDRQRRVRQQGRRAARQGRSQAPAS